MYKVDIDYVAEENQIIIIDEFSGENARSEMVRRSASIY